MRVYFLHMIPTRDEHTLWCLFLRGLTDHRFCLSGIPQSHSPQATALRLSTSCQPLLSESHARNCFTRILWEVT